MNTSSIANIKTSSQYLTYIIENIFYFVSISRNVNYIKTRTHLFVAHRDHDGGCVVHAYKQRSYEVKLMK